jgi:ribonuclease VapC
MFVDASALVALLAEETDWLTFIEPLEAASDKVLTEFVLMEAGLALMRIWQSPADATHLRLRTYMEDASIRIEPLTPAMILTALQAYERYGKGRGHPAQLNMGDCLSYAAARTLGVPLLYKGNDFARTDVRSALS